ncbi:MAG: cation:H+ antiporter [Cellvibrionaceae bacterium]|jgi:cation:H+ antiporter
MEETFPILAVVIIVVCIVGLWFGANWVVDSATRIARRVGMSDLVIGLTVVAIGTSAPEFAVTISSALSGQSDISVGNVIGSNIFNLGFILGGLALVAGIATTRTMVFRDGSMLIGTTVLLLVFLYDLTLTRYEGVILVTLLIVYISFLLYKRAESHEELSNEPFKWTDIPLFLVGIVVIVAAGHYFVEGASEIARFFGMSDWVIGVTIVAFGTSAPEIATSGIALRRGQAGLSAGNLIGSDLFNLLGVLGVASILAPGGQMVVDASAQESTYTLIAFVCIVVFTMWRGWRISRFEGGVLITLGVIRWIMDFNEFSIVQFITDLF